MDRSPLTVLHEARYNRAVTKARLVALLELAAAHVKAGVDPPEELLEELIEELDDLALTTTDHPPEEE
jgi:hypothetical protein